MHAEPEWFAPQNKQLIRVSDGESLAVWDQGGSGVPVLFLHGFPENHRCWGRALSQLTLSMPHLRCITYDLRGHGESSKQGEASWQRFFQDHLDLVAALGIDQYHLVGHDWGGAIGLHVSRFHPERLLSLVVLNTNYWKTDVGGMWHMLLLNIPIVAPLCFRWAPDRMFRAFIMKSLVDPGLADASVLASYRAAFEDRPTTSYWIRLYKNMAKGLIRQALPGFLKSKISTSAIAVPRSPENAFRTATTLIWGELDTFNPIPVGRAIEEGLKSYGATVRFEMIADAKHFVQEDQPEHVGRYIADHLSGFG
jgi:pimeloyl-ACP methyl ester carboxylesterase